MTARHLATLLLSTTIAAGGLAHAAAAASPRSAVQLAGPQVRLADLFDDAGPEADRVLGPSPPPGGRLVVGAAQLAAIARQFHVDWTPATQTERVVLERPGRAVPKEAILGALRTALAGAGCTGDCAVDLPLTPRLIVTPDMDPAPLVEQLDYDAAAGRFAAVLSVAASGEAPQRARVSGRAAPTVAVPVLARRLWPGAVITAADVQVARVRATQIGTETAQAPEQMVGRSLRHVVMPGQPVPLAELAAPELVRKGSIVTLQLDVGGLSLRAEGEALQAGGLGERIAVLNPLSHAVVQAEIVEPGGVRVVPGSLPMVPPQSGPIWNSQTWNAQVGNAQVGNAQAWNDRPQVANR